MLEAVDHSENICTDAVPSFLSSVYPTSDLLLLCALTCTLNVELLHARHLVYLT